MKYLDSCRLAAAAILLACATSSDQAKWAASLSAAPLTEGVSRTYSADFARTLQAAESALRTNGLVQEQDCPWSANQDLKPGEHVRCLGPLVGKIDEHTTSVYAWKYRGSGEHQWWNGDQVRLIVQETAPNHTLVRVLSKFRMQTVLGRQGDYSSAILDAIARQLK